MPVVKNLPAIAGDARGIGLIPGLGRSSVGEHGNPLQYSCLKNAMHRGAWWVTVHGVAKSQTQLSTLGISAKAWKEALSIRIKSGHI